MSKNRVRVTADPKSNEIIVKSENNDLYGHIRVEQERLLFDEQNGFMRATKLSALVHGEVSHLKKLGWNNDDMINGKIIFREQMMPFRKGVEGKKDIKVAGDTEIPCTVKGEPIYRQTFYSSNPDAQDVAIAHDNGEEIRAAYQDGVEKKKEVDEFKV